ncbi:MAG TPA: homogentisate 1,2-dioxygenase [Kofleriaceae bacterium]|nr:homogentisate 1,2-dioxygenase [Kofleriaceae bacterium]
MIERLVRGEVPRKHHIAHRPAGNLAYEHCITRDGFEGPYTICYHRQRPHTHAAVEIEVGWPAPVGAGGLALARRHYVTPQVDAGGPPVNARVPLLFNDDVVLSVARPNQADPVYVQNGDGDELLYIHQGGGTVRSLLGDVTFAAEDYVYLPKGVTYRILPDDGDQMWFSMECAGGIGIPKQWRNPVGQLRMDAPYCHRDFRGPAFVGPLDEGIATVAIKRRGQFFGFELPASPLDVIGWDGTVYPCAFAIRNFQPRAGLVHLPPTWHGTFAARGALICSFVPRLVDFHPEAVPCPYPHSSVDCDEVIFYCRGNFTSRRGIGEGSVSFHPAGLPHGPHPGAYEASIGQTRTDELAVMLDTYKPLFPTDAALRIEDPAYNASFR